MPRACQIDQRRDGGEEEVRRPRPAARASRPAPARRWPSGSPRGLPLGDPSRACASDVGSSATGADNQPGPRRSRRPARSCLKISIEIANRIAWPGASGDVGRVGVGSVLQRKRHLLERRPQRSGCTRLPGARQRWHGTRLRRGRPPSRSTVPARCPVPTPEPASPAPDWPPAQPRSTWCPAAAQGCRSDPRLRRLAERPPEGYRAVGEPLPRTGPTRSHASAAQRRPSPHALTRHGVSAAFHHVRVLRRIASR